jgi:hypothetical protein
VCDVKKIFEEKYIGVRIKSDGEANCLIYVVLRKVLGNDPVFEQTIKLPCKLLKTVLPCVLVFVCLFETGSRHVA